MAAINDLIRQITDPNLRDRIQKEVDKLAKQKKFGLVFEEHLPECTPLYDIPVRRGVKAALKGKDVSEFYHVLKVEDGTALCIKRGEPDAVEFPVEDLVTIAEFGDPIYPYLKSIDSVCNAPDSGLWHTLIEADNYHALQLLEYLYAGKVDCIYIDPPYNTGARDWKYNNDYVDGTDVYRHSKWLSMIQKRLKLAKKLLNPSESMIIIAIDDKECNRLGLLLEEIFPDAKITMISSVINPEGKAKKGGTDFSKVDEYVYFVQIGAASILPEKRDEENAPFVWEMFRRHSRANGRGMHGIGACGPNQFYPIYVNDETKKIVDIGQPIMEGVDRFSVPDLPGCTTVFPVRDDGTEMNWGALREEALDRLSKGYMKVTSYNAKKPQPYAISYLTGGTIKKIENGEAVVEGYDENGGIKGYFPSGKPKMPTTHWNKQTHKATTYGTLLLNSIIGHQRFDYPKSLYAVEDCLKIYVANKPNALIVDFFAGSGTTLHAVNLINAEDGGNRRCILITNNEVSDVEAKRLREKGLYPGDDEWEALGIAHYVTWPRTVCSIMGHNIDGNQLKGNYIDSDIPMSRGFATNAIFFKLGFLDKTAVALGMQFKEILPILWMKAGCVGRCPELVVGQNPDMLILPDNKFAVLVNEQAFTTFQESLVEHPEIETVFLATDYEVNYRSMVKNLNVEHTYQLYRDYLDHFRLSAGRS